MSGIESVGSAELPVTTPLPPDAAEQIIGRLADIGTYEASQSIQHLTLVYYDSMNLPPHHPVHLIMRTNATVLQILSGDADERLNQFQADQNLGHHWIRQAASNREDTLVEEIQAGQQHDLAYHIYAASTEEDMRETYPERVVQAAEQYMNDQIAML